MEPCEVNNVAVVGNAFLRTYISLHHDKPKQWRVRPKFHLLWHVINDVTVRKSKRNPALDSTWLDEDWIKKIQRVLKKCHKVTAPKTMLQRYLVALQHKLVEQDEKSLDRITKYVFFQTGRRTNHRTV